MPPRTTLQTVADAVGVSRATVSNAYNRPDQLAPGLRRRILDAAADLGYAGPDAAARSLRRGRTGSVGLLFAESLSYAFSDPFAVGFFSGLAEVLEQAATSLLLVPSDPADPAVAAAAVRAAVVDGVCLYGLPDDHPAGAVAKARGLRVVASNDAGDGTPCVVIDEHAAGEAVGRHLADLGHRRVTVLADGVSPPGHTGAVDVATVLASSSPEARERLRGCRDALLRAGGQRSDIRAVAAGTNSRAAGALAATEALRDGRPSAIFAMSDVLALGAADALARRGLAIGRDISVVGFDDVPEASAAGLTTVAQPLQERGRAVARLLLTLPDDAAARRVVLPTALVSRGSTGPVLQEEPGR